MFHLCNRRQFVQMTGLGSLALAFRPACLEAEDSRRKLSFAVISDTHLGYRDQTSAARQWEITAGELANSPAEFLLHLGDVVDGGREAQYPVYLKTREQIQKPIHEIPGNHDPANLFEKYLRKPIDSAVDHHWLRFLLLNNSRTDSHDGFLSKTNWTGSTPSAIPPRRMENSLRFACTSRSIPIGIPTGAGTSNPRTGKASFMRFWTSTKAGFCA